VRAWRITKRKYAEAAFEGFGARIAGGRWNSAGRSVVCLGGTPAIAALEVLVHDQSGEVLEESYVIIPVDIPDESVLELSKDARNRSRGVETQQVASPFLVDSSA